MTDLINFLTQLRTERDDPAAFLTLRGYKAHYIVEVLLKCGSLLNFKEDLAQRDLLSRRHQLKDKKRNSPDKAKHDSFFEMDVEFTHLKGKAKFNAEASNKNKRARTATVVRMHTLASSDDLAKMELDCLLENRENQTSDPFELGYYCLCPGQRRTLLTSWWEPCHN
jgi:hypothetical protein